MGEIVRRVELMRSGDDTVFTNEEVLNEFETEIVGLRATIEHSE